MSLPISTCLITRAVRNLGQSRLTLRVRLFNNRAKGACSIWPCQCKLKCQPTEEELEKFIKEEEELSGILSDLGSFMNSGSETTNNRWGSGKHETSLRIA